MKDLGGVKKKLISQGDQSVNDFGTFIGVKVSKLRTGQGFFNPSYFRSIIRVYSKTTIDCPRVPFSTACSTWGFFQCAS